MKGPPVAPPPQAIRDAAIRRDRSSPLAFVGREQEIEHFTNGIWMAAKGGKGAVSLYCGAPGMGKTALMNACIERMQHKSLDAGFRGEKNLKVLCAKMSVRSLSASPMRFARMLTEALVATGEDWQSRARRRGREALAIIGMLQAKNPDFSIQNMEDRVYGLDEQSSLDECLNAYAANLWPDGAVVSLSFDEMQMCGTDGNAQHNMMSLHLGEFSPRIAVSCFGLPGVVPVVESGLGLSRLSKNAKCLMGVLLRDVADEAPKAQLHALGMLPGGNAPELREEWLAFAKGRGFDELVADKWAERAAADVAQRAQGFPQHIAAGVAEICDSLVANERAFSPQNNLRKDMTARHEQAKRDYYEGRLGNEPFPQHAIALGALALLCQRHENGVPEDMAVNLLSRCSGPQEAKEAWRAAWMKGLFHRRERRPDDKALPPEIIRHSKGGSAMSAHEPPILTMALHLAQTYESALREGRPLAVEIEREFGVAPRPRRRPSRTPAPSMG